MNILKKIDDFGTRVATHPSFEKVAYPVGGASSFMLASGGDIGSSLFGAALGSGIHLATDIIKKTNKSNIEKFGVKELPSFSSKIEGGINSAIDQMLDISERGTRGERAALVGNKIFGTIKNEVSHEIIEPTKKVIAGIKNKEISGINGFDYGAAGVSAIGVVDGVHLATSAISVNPMGMVGALAGFSIAKMAYIGAKKSYDPIGELLKGKVSIASMAKIAIQNRGAASVYGAAKAAKETVGWINSGKVNRKDLLDSFHSISRKLPEHERIALAKKEILELKKATGLKNELDTLKNSRGLSQLNIDPSDLRAFSKKSLPEAKRLELAQLEIIGIKNKKRMNRFMDLTS